MALGAALGTLALVTAALELVGQRLVDRLLASRADPAGGTAIEGAPTVLCVGDSYTFGVYYRSEESYPGRLAEILRAGDPPWNVVNCGIPAQNLLQVADRLPDQLARIKPRAVVILGGFNDRWNFAGARQENGGDGGGIFENLVVVKLARFAFTDAPDERTRIGTFTASEIAVATDEGTESIDVEKTGEILAAAEHEARVATRLETLVEQVRGAGAVPLLCSYPSPERIYEPPSRTAADVARRTSVPFVDLRAAFATELERHKYDELFIPGDKHPTERGYWRMAVLVARVLAEAKVWTPAAGFADALASAPQSDFALPPLAETVHPIGLEVGEGTRLELRGPPGARYHLLLARSREPAQRFGRIEIALADDDLFRRALGDERLSAQLDERGRAIVTLPEELAAEARFALLVVLHDLLLASTDLSVRGVAGPVALR